MFRVDRLCVATLWTRARWRRPGERATDGSEFDVGGCERTSEVKGMRIPRRGGSGAGIPTDLHAHSPSAVRSAREYRWSRPDVNVFRTPRTARQHLLSAPERGWRKESGKHRRRAPGRGEAGGEVRAAARCWRWCGGTACFSLRNYFLLPRPPCQVKHKERRARHGPAHRAPGQEAGKGGRSRTAVPCGGEDRRTLGC